MKKLFLLFFLSLNGFTNSYAQDEDFVAVTAGYVNASTKEKTIESSNNTNDSGFYAGVIMERYINYEFWLQVELLYANVNDISYIQLPVMAKFYVSDSFSILAGPQISYTLNKVAIDARKLGVGVNLGLGYSISKNLNAFTGYTFQLNNYDTGTGDYSLKTNFFKIGLAYELKTFK